MKILLIILIGFGSHTIFGQLKNGVFYLKQGNIQSLETTLMELNRDDSEKFCVMETRTDSTITQSIVSRKKSVQLDSIEHKQLMMFLSKVIGRKFDDNKNTLIHLYNSDKNISENIKYKHYWNWIKRHKSKYQSFLIGTKNSGIKTDSRKHVFLDNYNLLENLFFKNSTFDINHVSIKSNGEIYIYYGIEDILWVLDWSE